jgi:NADH dehydrogenase/NADH:ubiquinone oxidoreductase subunit G
VSPPLGNRDALLPLSAHDIVLQAASEMQDRAVTYDKPAGERSMGATVAVTGVSMTEEQGWLFMALLKAVRSQQGNMKTDNYVDGSAYFALAGEAAQRDR